MSINNVDLSWLKQERVMTGTINLKPVLEKVWDDLSNKTKEIFFNPKPGMFSRKKISEDYFRLENAARSQDGDPTPTSINIDNYFRPPARPGGRKKRRTKRKSRKAKRTKKKGKRSRRTRK
jgi:hypothetical protein